MLHCFPSLAKGLGVPVEEWHGNARLGIRHAQSFQDRLDQLRYAVTRQTAYSQAAANGGAAWSRAMRRRGGTRSRVPVACQQVRLVDDREMRPLLDGGKIFGRCWLTAVENEEHQVSRSDLAPSSLDTPAFHEIIGFEIGRAHV